MQQRQAAIIAFPGVKAGAPVFTSRDLLTLLNWEHDAAGDRRLVIERGLGGDNADGSAFALIYGADNAWAEWGVTRSGAYVDVWSCRTGTDFGRFASMQAALHALPGEGGVRLMAPFTDMPGAMVVPLRRQQAMHA